MGLALAYLKMLTTPHRLEGVRASPWIRGQMGDRAADVVWDPLLRAKFGDAAETIALPWFWARVHDRTAKLGYLSGGFQRLYEALADAVAAHGGDVRLGREVTLIQPAGERLRVVHQTAGSGAGGDPTEDVFDLVLSTLPTRLTARLAPELPDEWRERHDPGPALGAHCLILALDRPLTDAYWINLNDPGFPFLALVEHTNMRSPAEYGGRHIVYLGSYRPMDDPVLKTDSEQLLTDWLPALQRLNPNLDRSWVTQVWGFAAPFAQPIVTVDYASRIPPFETPVPRLWIANMFQVYPHDRGQNYSIELAERVVSAMADSVAGGS
jgi:protoporphyrinogen oxidase